MSAEVLRLEPVAGGSSRGSGGKLGLLINKLHTFLAVSTEQGGEHSLPGHWSGAMAKEFIEQQQAESRAAEECMQPGISSEAKSSAARSRRKPLVVTKHSGLNESDASSESGNEDVLSINSSDPDTTCLPKGVYSRTLEQVSPDRGRSLGSRELRGRGRELGSRELRGRGRELGARGLREMIFLKICLLIHTHTHTIHCFKS
ncbi:transcriptional regulator ATRX-like [Tachysurus ichikawai]